MSKLRVNAFTVSADGFGAGRDQGRDQPLGLSAGRLMTSGVASEQLSFGGGMEPSITSCTALRLSSEQFSQYFQTTM
jgi:hypothetical protein